MITSLDLQGNKIEGTNCRDLPKLEDVSLANNNLASVHGLEGCNGVMSLNLSNNKITRIGKFNLLVCKRLTIVISDDARLNETCTVISQCELRMFTHSTCN